MNKPRQVSFESLTPLDLDVLSLANDLIEQGEPISPNKFAIMLDPAYEGNIGVVCRAFEKLRDLGLMEKVQDNFMHYTVYGNYEITPKGKEFAE